MKMKIIPIASVLLATCLWAGDQKTASTTPPAPAVPAYQLPLVGPTDLFTNNEFNPKNYPMVQSGAISGRFLFANGKRIGTRSEFIVQQDLNAARTSYLAGRAEPAVASLLKAALLLQEDMNLAKAPVQAELRGWALTLEQEAKRIADGHGDPVSHLDVIFHAARLAARDYDSTRMGT